MSVVIIWFFSSVKNVNYIHCLKKKIKPTRISGLKPLEHDVLFFLYMAEFSLLEFFKSFYIYLCFPGGSEVKASAWNAGDLGSIPELGRSPGEGNGNPFQYSCLENPMDGGAW